MNNINFDLNNIKRIYYRGYSKLCNYKCSYCPFRKKSDNINRLNRNEIIKELELDKKYLNNFVNFIKNYNFNNQISILFTPYGEALNNQYYYDAIIRLSKIESVENICCQTNLSFNIENFLNYIEDNKGIIEKISLWASFHSEMISISDFTDNVKKISEKINISVGTVGYKDNRKNIENLRKYLPKHIYLWINKIEGKYDDVDFSYIDPFYNIEQKNLKCDINKCSTIAESIFIKEDGKIFSCNKNKTLIGNIYKNSFYEIDNIKKTKCDCYLSYSNRKDIKQLQFLNLQSRLLNFKRPKAIFFDIDGTIINKYNNYFDIIKYIYENYNIDMYFATGRSLKNVIISFKNIITFFKGGVFDYGAHTKVFNSNLDYKLYINNKSKNTKIISKKKLYEDENTRIIYEDNNYIKVNKNVNKYFGVNMICKKFEYNNDDVWVLGNSKEDVCILKNYKYSFTMFNSDEYALNSANMVISLDMILMFLGK